MAIEKPRRHNNTERLVYKGKCASEVVTYSLADLSQACSDVEGHCIHYAFCSHGRNSTCCISASL